MAQWCREHDLRDESDEHLERILQLEPDDAEARRLLGYRQENGRWMSRDEVMASRGMVRYDGRYVTRQHVELAERAKQLRELDVQWNSRLDRLRGSLVGRRSDRADQARQEILAIHDPAAAEAVVDLLRREKDPLVRQLWIQVAAQIDHPATLDAPAHLSTRRSGRRDPPPMPRRRDSLRPPGHRDALHSGVEESRQRNHQPGRGGAWPIGDTGAIGPLIDALETKHTVTISSGTQGQYAISFSPSGGTGYSFGGGSPKTTTSWVRNPCGPTAALTRLAGVKFRIRPGPVCAPGSSPRRSSTRSTYDGTGEREGETGRLGDKERV